MKTCTNTNVWNLNLFFFCSENESVAAKTEEKKKRVRVKRRKTLEKNPRLTILSYENESGEVECRLEISNKNNITFKFSLENDKPQEIAESLVRCQCYRI